MHSIFFDDLKSGKLFRSVMLIAVAALILGFIQALFINTGFIGNWMGVLSGLDYLMITTLQTVLEIVHILSLLICGLLTLKYPCIRVLRLGVFFSVIGIFGLFLFPNLAGYFVCYCGLFGFGSATAGYAVMFIVVSPLLDERYVGLAAGVLCCCGNGFSSFLFPILENILQNIPAQMVFLILGLLGCCLLPILSYLARKREMHDVLHPLQLNKEKNSLLIPALIKDILTKKWFYVLCFIFFILGVILNAPNSFLQELLSFYYGVTGISAVLYLTFFNLSFLFGSVIFGLLLSKIRSKICFSGIIFILIAVSLVFSILDTPLEVGALVLFFDAFVLASLTPALSLYVQEKTGFLKFVSVYTILSICMTIGSAADTYLVGLWYHVAQDLIFADIYGIWLIIAAGIAALCLGLADIRKRNGQSKKMPPEKKER